MTTRPRHHVACAHPDCTTEVSIAAHPDDPPTLEDWAAALGWDPRGDGWVCPAHVDTHHPDPEAS